MKKIFHGPFIATILLLGGITWASAAGTPAGTEWQRKWDEVVAAAKKEGSLVMYGNMVPKQIKELQQGFSNKYGIKLDIVSGKSGEVAARWSRERDAGLNLVDIFIMGGGSAVLTMKPKGAFGALEPYLILPEVKDSRAWRGGKIPFLDKTGAIIPLNSGWTSYVAINTSLMKEGDLRSYKDLLDPKWKGKIVMYDPRVAGASAGWATLMITDVFGLEGGKEFLRQFAATEPAMVRDVRLQVEWVAKGKYPIGIGVQHALVSQFKAKGAPLNITRFMEGGNLNPGANCLEVAVNPPHPNAATLFINWILSKEGQITNAKGTGAPPARLDVPMEGLGIDDSKIARAEDKAFLTTEEFFQMQGKAMKIAKEIWSK